MSRHSAALLAYWMDCAGPQPHGADLADHVHVLIGHMGGPFWAHRNAGAWSLPKGEFDPASEDPGAAARREFVEETGIALPDGPMRDLGEFAQPSGKRIHAFALPFADRVPFVASNEFDLEWPRGSGRVQSFPEIDRALWFPVAQALEMVVSGQVAILTALLAAMGESDIPG